MCVGGNFYGAHNGFTLDNDNNRVLPWPQIRPVNEAYNLFKCMFLSYVLRVIIQQNLIYTMTDDGRDFFSRIRPGGGDRRPPYKPCQSRYSRLQGR